MSVTGPGTIYVAPGESRPFTLQGPPGIGADLRVRVEDAADAVVVAETGAGITEFAAGAYRKSITAPEAPGIYWVIWRRVSSGEESTDEFEVTASGAPPASLGGYPSTADLVGASSVIELTSLGPGEQDALRGAAIGAIERYCRQRFVAEGTVADPITKAVDGTNIDTIDLPMRLAEITAIAIDGQIHQLADVQVSPSGDAIVLVSPAGGSWMTRVRRRPGDPGPIFAWGRSNVLITGVWGWTADDWSAGLLADVAAAIRFDMEDHALADANALSETVRSSRQLGVDSITQGGLSLTLLPGEPGLSVRVRRRLGGFRWRGPVGALA